VGEDNGGLCMVLAVNSINSKGTRGSLNGAHRSVTQTNCEKEQLMCCGQTMQ